MLLILSMEVLLMKKLCSLVLAVVTCVLFVQVGEAADTSYFRFNDVPKDAWYLEELDYATANGIVSGTSKTTFSPDMALTRAQFVTLLGKAFGARVDAYGDSQFTDVSSSSYYAQYVSWASQNGYVNGTSFTTFSPGDNLTFEQLARILDNFITKSGWRLPDTPTEYSDVYSASSWAVSSLEAMQRYGIIPPDDEGKVNPKATVTRADGVVSLVLLKKAIVLGESVEGIDDPAVPLTDSPYSGGDVFSRFIVGSPKSIIAFDINDVDCWRENIAFMLKTGASSLDLNIRYQPGCKAFSQAVSNFRPYGCRISIVYSSSSARLCIQRPTDGDIVDALNRAVSVHKQLYSSGVVNSGMSELKRARVFYDYIIDNCEYDYSVVGLNSKGHAAHTAYGALVKRLAVCDGYASGYNLLLSLDGIACGMVYQDSPAHAWSSVVCDGLTYHMDASWGDTSGRGNDYFAMTPAEAFARFN